MSYRTALRPGPSSAWPEKYSPEALRQIGRQAGALLSQHGSLEMYRRSIERQLSLIADQIHEEDVLLVPRSVFLLLELRGCGGVSAHLEQIARILREVGYWKPPARVQDYHRQDIYHLGKSAQRLFDDYAALDQRVKLLHVWLGQLEECQHMAPKTAPQAVFEGLASAPNVVAAQEGVDAMVELLGQSTRPRWFGWLFARTSRRNDSLIQ